MGFKVTESGKIKHVGLIAYMLLNGMVYAILQRRGMWNHEKMAPESGVGGYQPTVHGKIDENDSSPVDALIRETEEELGSSFVGVLMEAIALDKVHRFFEGEGFYTVIFITPEDYSRIRLGPSTGGLLPVSRAVILRVEDLRKYGKTEHIPTEVVAMFKDDLKFLTAGFEVFRAIGR